MSALTHSLVPWLVIAYLVGSIPTGVLLAHAKGIDLRKVGSGNIGATNAARALGARWGVVVLVLDAIKSAFPVALASQPWALGSLPEPEPALACVAFTAVLGHIFPLYLRFRGGKGVACGLGIFVALDPPIALVAIAMYVQGLWLTRISAVGSLTAVSSIVGCVLIADKPVPYQVLAVVTAALIWSRHTENIRSLLAEAKQRKSR